MFGALAWGCSEVDFHRDVDVNSSPGPEIEVAPQDLSWEQLSGGQQQAEAFLIRSLGDEALTVSALHVVEGADSFRIEGVSLPLTLQPEETRVVDVIFSPIHAGASTGRVEIEADDPDEFLSAVTLLGLGSVPEVGFDPDPMALGEVGVGCVQTAPVRILSIGTEPLVLGEIDFAGDISLSMEHAADLPIVLEPGASVDVEFTVRPTGRGLRTGALDTVSNDRRERVGTDVTFTGVYADEVVEGFLVPAPGPVDILFAVDQTPSMLVNQEALADAFGTFIAELGSVVPDWQVGVVTEDHGCFNQGLLTPDQPAYADNFALAVAGTPGTLSEALLELSSLALDQIGGCNAGFARPDAQVHVIVVTDEYEQSGEPWDSWVDQMVEAVGDAERLVISGIVDLTLSCGDPFGAGYAGYGEAAEATGGVLLDICDPLWTESIRDLAGVSTESYKTFPLDQIPDPDSIEVLIDGVATVDWSWVAASNTIHFDGDFDGGENVEISYGTFPDCD